MLSDPHLRAKYDKGEATKPSCGATRGPSRDWKYRPKPQPKSEPGPQPKLKPAFTTKLKRMLYKAFTGFLV